MSYSLNKKVLPLFIIQGIFTAKLFASGDDLELFRKAITRLLIKNQVFETYEELNHEDFSFKDSADFKSYYTVLVSLNEKDSVVVVVDNLNLTVTALKKESPVVLYTDTPSPPPWDKAISQKTWIYSSFRD